MVFMDEWVSKEEMLAKTIEDLTERIKNSDKYEFLWFNPVSDCVLLTDTRKFNKFKKLSEKKE